MPTYVYRFIDTGETIEVQQAFTDPTLTEYAHPDTGQTMAVKKVFQPVGVTFKGSGFFKTDSRGKPSTTKDTGSSSGDSSSGDSSSGGASSSDAASTSTAASTAKTESPPSKPAAAAAG